VLAPGRLQSAHRFSTVKLFSFHFIFCCLPLHGADVFFFHFSLRRFLRSCFLFFLSRSRSFALFGPLWCLGVRCPKSCREILTFVLVVNSFFSESLPPFSFGVVFFVDVLRNRPFLSRNTSLVPRLRICLFCCFFVLLLVCREALLYSVPCLSLWLLGGLLLPWECQVFLLVVGLCLGLPFGGFGLSFWSPPMRGGCVFIQRFLNGASTCPFLARLGNLFGTLFVFDRGPGRRFPP